MTITQYPPLQKPSGKPSARAAPKSRAAPQGHNHSPAQLTSPANAPVPDTPIFSTRLEAAGAGLASLGFHWDPAWWAKESATLHAALDCGAAAGTRTSGGKNKGSCRTPTAKDSGKALQSALHDLDTAIKQWNAAALALEQRTAQVKAGVYVVTPATSPARSTRVGASSPPAAAPEGRRVTKVPPKFAQFETDAMERRAGKGRDDDGRGGKRARKLPSWLAKDHEME